MPMFFSKMFEAIFIVGFLQSFKLLRLKIKNIDFSKVFLKKLLYAVLRFFAGV